MSGGSQVLPTGEAIGVRSCRVGDTARGDTPSNQKCTILVGKIFRVVPSSYCFVSTVTIRVIVGRGVARANYRWGEELVDQILGGAN